METDAAEARRFSPLNAPQRAAVEAFCKEARPWALRQAKRTYRHLPDEHRQIAVDHALRELRAGSPRSVDRRTLYAELSGELTDALRAVHAGWCLNEAEALWRQEGPVAVPGDAVERDTAGAVASFVEDGLGGLERAVLQLEIGAGRDTRTVRAALKLRPREYQRHRDEGMSKLRGAVFGNVRGHVCDDHLDQVTLAATGDVAAMDSLGSGPARCRSCAREAAGLRRVLQERLAVSPWPLAIKPAGVLATKAGIFGAVAAGKGGGVTAAITAGPVGTGAGAMATMIAAAALATGASALIESDGAPKSQADTPAIVAPDPANVATIPIATATPAATKPRTTKPARRRSGENRTRRSPGSGGGSTAGGQAPASSPNTPSGASAPPSSGSRPTTSDSPRAPTGGGGVGGAVGGVGGAVGGMGGAVTNPGSVNDTTNGVVDGVRDTVDPVVDQLPAPVADQLNSTLDSTQDALDQVTGVVDDTVGGAVGGLLP